MTAAQLEEMDRKVKRAREITAQISRWDDAKELLSAKPGTSPAAEQTSQDLVNLARRLGLGSVIGFEQSIRAAIVRNADAEIASLNRALAEL